MGSRDKRHHEKKKVKKGTAKNQPISDILQQPLEVKVLKSKGKKNTEDNF